MISVFSSNYHLITERGDEPLISFTQCNTTPSPSQGPHRPDDASDSQPWYTKQEEESHRPPRAGNVLLMTRDQILELPVAMTVNIVLVVTMWETYSALQRDYDTTWTFVPLCHVTIASIRVFNGGDRPTQCTALLWSGKKTACGFHSFLPIHIWKNCSMHPFIHAAPLIVIWSEMNQVR